VYVRRNIAPQNPSSTRFEYQLAQEGAHRNPMGPPALALGIWGITGLRATGISGGARDVVTCGLITREVERT
jgi:hypothetical protein